MFLREFHPLDIKDRLRYLTVVLLGPYILLFSFYNKTTSAFGYAVDIHVYLTCISLLKQQPDGCSINALITLFIKTSGFSPYVHFSIPVQ